MYTGHQEFSALEDNAILWRYFDLSRYLDLLIREKLFFPCATILEDPFEGIYQHSQERQRHENQDAPLLAVSSWHNNIQENYAMWKIYAHGDAGLAIQTTFGQLKNCFQATDMPIWIGKVTYYEDDKQPVFNKDQLYAPFLHKRAIYAYENEVRCCYKVNMNSDNEYTWEEQGQLYGVFIPVNLSLLIGKIYISPYAPEWFRELIAGVNQRLGIDKEIVHSRVFKK